MAGNRHDRGENGQFLDREFRQVWAVDRVTGGYHYLPEGMADEFRERAKAEWKCPVPGCDGPITTRGKSRRAHFSHLVATEHPRESEAHLAAKAMLSSWATTRYPTCKVREEVVLRIDEFDVHRQPDVLVTGGSRPVALEVEYKTFDPALWSAKQDDFERIGHVAAWFIGHRRLKEHPNFQGRQVPIVRTTPLMRAIGQRGMHVFAINPMTREVASLSGDGNCGSKLSADSRYAWLWVHSLDDCELSAVTGLETPATRRIDAQIAARAAQFEAEAAQEAARLEAEAAARARRMEARLALLKAEAQRREEEEEQKREKMLRKQALQERLAQARARYARELGIPDEPTPAPPSVRTRPEFSRWATTALERWGKSADRMTLIDLFGAVPNFISWHACTIEESTITEVTPDEWHARIYLALIENQLPSRTVTTEMAVKAVIDAGLAANSPVTRKAVAKYLANLAQRGVLNRRGDDFTTKTHGHLTPSGPADSHLFTKTD